MAESIPEDYKGLLTGTTFANVATIMKDGTPQVTPTWVDYDGEHVIFNTVEGRLKARNLDRNPHVAISVLDPENPYRYIQVRGEVAEKTTEGADEHIDKLAKRYMNLDEYPYRNPEEQRVIYKIRPTKVQAYG